MEKVGEDLGEEIIQKLKELNKILGEKASQKAIAKPKERLQDKNPDSILPEWVKVLHKAIADSKNKPSVENFDLNEVALERLKSCKTKNNIILFKDVWTKLCTCFSITKSDCWKFLRYQQYREKLEIVPYHGIRVLKV